uniref:ACT domain-containing protein ACR n=1 Tax=Tanacetum cinerariifolium TaxID=118510 RepID=A0A6L2M1A7_TANCI|nr:ACT domain-containing protein ACR9-like [Tanacetum cinerariifolium]
MVLRSAVLPNCSKPPALYLLTVFSLDRKVLIHDVTKVLCELELAIQRVKVTTTPDEKVLDMFFITDGMDQLHTKIRREETCEHLSLMLGACCISCELHLAGPGYNVQQGRSCISEAIAEELFSNELFAKEDCLSSDVLKVKKASITVDNLLSPTHTLLQIHCLDQKGLVYDILKISKDCDIRDDCFTTRQSNQTTKWVGCLRLNWIARLPYIDTMADVNVNAPADQAPTMAPPTRTDDQILPHIRWRKHKFHLRPDSPLHLPNEEHVLGYLKFSAKGTKREVFGMPIPDNLVTADIQGEPYYKEYPDKVANHQRYLAGEKGSDPDSPAPKPAKATKKSKPSAPKADLRPPVTKPASSQQLEPKPAQAKSRGKKRKLVTETYDKPSPAKRSKPGFVTKRRKPTSSLRSVGESVDEGIPEKEPRFDDEEAEVQRALEESLKSVYNAPRGPLPPVVIREPESEKYQPLPEVQGKGKKKVTDEQVSLDLLTLQTPKKKSHADQFIFQRRTSTPTESSGHDESSSSYAELGLTSSGVKSDEDAGPNPGEQDECQTGPNTGDAATSQPQSSPIVHAGPNLKHMDLEATDVSTQPHPEQMDEGFTATAYPKTTAETEAESMVSVIIQQDTSSIPPMTTPIIDLTSRPDSSNRIGELEQIMVNLIQDNKHLEERDLSEADMKEILHQRMWETNSYNTYKDHMMLYEALEKSMNCDHTEELLKDLAEARKKKKKRHDSLKTPPGSPPHQPPPPSPPAGPSRTSRSLGASGSSQVPPPPPPPLSINQEYLHMDNDMAPDAQVHSSDDEDIENAHIPKVNLWKDWWKPLEEDRPATLEPAWSIPSYDYQMEECHKLLTDSVDDSIIKHNVRKPLPLGGSASQVTIQSDFFFNKELEYLRYGSNGSRPALSILKMKAAYYLDVGLEQVVPD